MFDRASFADTCSQRANIIEWLPFEKGQSVVIHATVASAVLDMLRTKEVQLQVMSEAHIEKLAMNPGKGSLDYIILLGMEINAEMLAGLYRKLKPTGHLVVMLHNKYGMSYLAGKNCYGLIKEQMHKDGQSKNGRTAFCSRKGLKKMIGEAGIHQYTMYYADPEGDYAVNIYSDAYLPKAGDCNLKARNFIYDRLEMFDEAEGLDGAVKEEMFPTFANDYLLVTGPKLPQVMIRYSNDRAAEYRIRTDICTDNEGNLAEVRKTPLHASGVPHVMGMERTYGMLCNQYPGDTFTFVPCSWDGTCTAFPFVHGVTLAEKMQEALQNDDEDTVFTLFHTFLKKLRTGRKSGFANYDFIFSNILMDGDKWQVIDYEWTMNRDVSAEELAFRAAYCFSLEHSAFPFADICQILDFDKKDVQLLIEKETAYQRRITGGQPSLEALCAAEGGDVYTGTQVMRALELATEDNRVQIYEDSGHGFSEEKSYFMEHVLTAHDEMELTLQISSGMKAVRMDPCEEPCLLQIKHMWWNGKEVFLDKNITANGIKGKGDKSGYAEYLFATKDPNFTVPLDKLEEEDTSRNELKLQLEVHKLSLQLANSLAKSMKRII